VSSSDPRIVCRHADVVAVAHDPETFSNASSRFLQVPNGTDGEEHREWRRLLDPFFAADRLAPLVPRLEQIAAALVETALTRSAEGRTVCAVRDLGARYAVRAQSAWLGWPSHLEDELLAWIGDNYEATRSGDLERTASVARRFDDIVRRLVMERRVAGRCVINDVTAELTRLRGPDGLTLTDDVLVSILRNWTGGDLGSLALCTGVIVHWLASDPARQDEWRVLDDDALDAAIDEVLRIDDPFVTSRRVATRDATVGGESYASGERLHLDWAVANRDPEQFGDPDAYDPERNRPHNLVWGTGVHVCPGRPLATMELRVLTRVLLDGVTRLTLDGDRPSVRLDPPGGGWRRVPVVVSKQS
jgi:cytochrome P450